MDLDLTPQQSAFRDEVRRFIAEHLPAGLRERMRMGHAVPRAELEPWQRLLHERGWAAPHWPREYGGGGLGTIEKLILFDELSQAPAPQPLIFNLSMLGPVLIEYGTEWQKSEFLPKLARLDLWFCQGFSEPGAGSDLAGLRTAARREGEHYIVDGQKIWTSTAHMADWIFALVRTEKGARKQDGISFLLMDLKTPGITVRPIIGLDGKHHLNEVFFDAVRVPAENLVGQEGQGWAIAKFLLGSERTAIANVGYCRERLDHARELAGGIRRNGRLLIEDPGVQTALAVLDAELRSLQVGNWRYLTRPDEAPEAFASLLKLKATMLRQEIQALIARLAGPDAIAHSLSGDAAEAGFEPWQDMPFPNYFYSRAASIYGGSSEVQKDIVARSALG